MKNSTKKAVSINAVNEYGLIFIIVYPGLSMGFALHCLFSGETEGVFFFGALWILMITLVYWTIPQWFIKIIFLPDGIRIKAARKKPTVRPYKYYQYVYKASYWHGSPIGIGIIKDYIVISHRRLNDAELCNINQVAGSTDIIKIKYSPKTYRTLMDTLPREMAYKLKVCRFE